ncbi:hypothetical protein C4579_02845 [Candidatus Microgenomates bacterium]|nr:MAG: hypothetical protein C4579_02845 [Candidatus Microgenomates bacterium]
MYPTLVTIGSFSLGSFGVLLALSFIIFSYLVWKQLRDRGIDDEKIFDHIISVAAVSLLSARLIYVLLYPQVFMGNVLAVFLIWIYPGLSFWGGVLGASVGTYVFAKMQKLRIIHVTDAYALAAPYGFILVSLGLFLDGTILGKETNWITGMQALDQVRRHPIGLYAAILTTLYLLIEALIHWRVNPKNIPKGVFSWLMLFFIGWSNLILAFFRDDLLYFQGISIDVVVATVTTVVSVVMLASLLHVQEALQQMAIAIQQKWLKKKEHI